MTLDIEVFRKEDRDLNFTVEHDGTAVDLTDSTVHFEVKDKQASGDNPVIDEETTNGNADGTVEITLDNSQTDVTARVYEYELWVEFDDGTEYSAETGDFDVKKRVKK